MREGGVALTKSPLRILLFLGIPSLGARYLWVDSNTGGKV